MSYSGIHFNGNLLCAIDTETTGLKPGHHEILDLCILPLGLDLKPSKQFRMFNIKIKPEHPERTDPEAHRMNSDLMRECLIHGIDRWAAVDMLSTWFKKLNLPERKKIVPLGSNYQHDRAFIQEFLGGFYSYDEFFRSDCRDCMLMALMVNDQYDWHSDKIPFPKTKLGYLATTLGIEANNAHTALGDCLTSAEVYKRLLRWKDYWVAKPLPASEITQDEIRNVVNAIKTLNSNLAPDVRSASEEKIIRNFLSRTGRESASG